VGDRTGCHTQDVSRQRLEAFTDGVIAILITIMVLNLHKPVGHGFRDLRPLAPTLLVYLLSFTFLAIYWNNHHHLMQVVERIDGRVLWANMGLLFCLSLTPIATAWLGPNTDQVAPAVTYGVVLLASAVSYFVLTRALLSLHPPESRLAQALGADRKGKLSVVAYIAGMCLAFVSPPAAIVVYVAVAVAWLVPDRRITRITGGDAAPAD
jgi:uncharacterized membrane protein